LWWKAESCDDNGFVVLVFLAFALLVFVCVRPLVLADNPELLQTLSGFNNVLGLLLVVNVVGGVVVVIAACSFVEVMTSQAGHVLASLGILSSSV
jgi:hypothetical protein